VNVRFRLTQFIADEHSLPFARPFYCDDVKIFGVSKPKYMAYPVNDLTEEQLRLERNRCAGMLRLITSGPANKGLKKRLHEIERRIAREGSDKED
jgi:hypothetical protein